MKTTIEISDDLALRAKEFARSQQTTLRALVEAGLRHVLKETPASEFQLADHSFGGKGLKAEFQDAQWSEIRQAAYGERGG